MSWRIVVCRSAESLSVKNNQLVMRCGDEQRTVPLEDIDTLIVENERTVISIPTICCLAEHRISALFSDGKHLPRAWLLATHRHSRQLTSTDLVRRQSKPMRKQLWQRLVQEKIGNQARVASRHANEPLADYLRTCASKVRSGDASGQEAVAAAAYFRKLWPSTRRDATCQHNALANYGYAIVRSSLARYLVVYGFDLSFGIHHSSVQNPQNLVDDLLEPFRPFVDDKVLTYFASHPELVEGNLSPEAKLEMVAAMQGDIGLTGRRSMEVCTLLDATRLVVDSLKSLLESDSIRSDEWVLPRFG